MLKHFVPLTDEEYQAKWDHIQATLSDTSNSHAVFQVVAELLGRNVAHSLSLAHCFTCPPVPFGITGGTGRQDQNKTKLKRKTTDRGNNNIDNYSQMRQTANGASSSYPRKTARTDDNPYAKRVGFEVEESEEDNEDFQPAELFKELEEEDDDNTRLTGAIDRNRHVTHFLSQQFRAQSPEY